MKNINIITIHIIETIGEIIAQNIATNGVNKKTIIDLASRDFDSLLEFTSTSEVDKYAGIKYLCIFLNARILAKS